MQGRRERVHHLHHELGQRGVLGKGATEGANLAFGRDLAGEQQPEHAFGEHLLARLALREDGLALLDGSTVETDALVGVKDRTLPEHPFDAAAFTGQILLHCEVVYLVGGSKPHAADGVLDLDFAEGLLAVFGLELLEHFALLGDDGFQGFFEVFLGAGAGGGIAAGGEGDCAEREGDSELGAVSVGGREERGGVRWSGVEWSII